MKQTHHILNGNLSINLCWIKVFYAWMTGITTTSDIEYVRNKDDTCDIRYDIRAYVIETLFHSPFTASWKLLWSNILLYSGLEYPFGKTYMEGHFCHINIKFPFTWNKNFCITQVLLFYGYFAQKMSQFLVCHIKLNVGNEYLQY